MRKIILSTVLIIIVSFCQAQTIAQKYSYEAVTSQGSLYVEDLDNDGILEVITLINNFGITKFIVYKYINGRFIEMYRSKRSVFPDGFLGTVHIFDKNKDGIKDLLFCDGLGSILGLDGTNFEPIFQFNSNMYLYSSILADVDEDGLKNDLISSALLACYNLSKEITLWQGYNGTVYNLMSGDVDGDSKNDIVYSHSLFDTISVFNPLSQKVKWNFKPDSLGIETSSILRLIDVDGDGIKEILIKNGDQINIIEGLTHTTIKRFKVLSGIILDVIDINGDGRDELLLNDGNKYHIYDCNSGMKISTVFIPFSFLSSRIGDFDPNPGLEAILQSPNPNINLVVVSLLSGEILSIDYNKQSPFCLLPVKSNSNNSKNIVRYNLLVEDNKYNNYLSINDVDEDTVLHQRKLINIKGTGIRLGKFFNSDDKQILFYGDSIDYSTQAYFGSKIHFLSTDDLHTIAEFELPQAINSFYIEDTDGDGVDEIWAKIGNSIHKFVFTGQIFEQTLIRNFDKYFFLMGFFNIDNDPQFELVYTHNYTSSHFPGHDTINIFDTKDKVIQQKIEAKFSIHHAQAGTDPVSGKKLLYTVFEGQITGFDPLTGEVIKSGGIHDPLASSPPFIIKNIDEDPEDELITFNLSGQLAIRSMDDFKLLNNVKNQPGFNGVKQFELFDAFDDDHMDIVVSDENGAIWFALEEPLKDGQLPFVVSNNLQQFNSVFPTNIQPVIYFNEPIDPLSIHTNSITIKDADGNYYETDYTYDDTDSSLTIKIIDVLPVSKNITLELQGLLDLGGNPLDGNGNNKADGVVLDKYVINFNTGAGKDLNGPLTYGEVNNYFKIWQYQNIIVPLHFRDTLDDISSNIHELEYFIDVPGVAGTGIKFCEYLKHRNSIVFDIQLSIETKNIEPGVHTIYFHALDGAGNWGNNYEIQVEIIAAGSSWYVQGGNGLRNGNAPTSKVGYVFKERWSAAIDGKALKTAVCAEGKIVCYEVLPDDKLKIRCFEEKTGQIVWEKIIHEIVEKALGATYGIGNYYITYFNDSSIIKTLCLSIDEGKSIWSLSSTGQLSHFFQPVYDKGDIFLVGDVKGDIYSINASEGYENWSTNLTEEYNVIAEAHTLDAPVILNDSIFVSSSIEMYKINKNTGTIFNSYLFGSDPSDQRYNPTVADSCNNKLIWSRGDMYYIVNSWNLRASAAYRTTSVVQPALKGDTLFIEIWGQIFGLSTRDYNIKYFQDQQYRTYIYPFTLSQNYLYASSHDSLYVFDNHSGLLKNTIGYSGMVSLTDSSIVIVDTIRNKITVLQNDLELSQDILPDHSTFSATAIPNPFSENVMIRFSIPNYSTGKIIFYDSMGKKIDEIKSLHFNKGINEYIWEKPGLTSGTYLYTIISESNIFSGKMLHIEYK